jgi:glycosyltransferase involved in cell wall biosynthesis
LILLFAAGTALYLLLLALAAIALLAQRTPENRVLQGISVIVAARNEERNLPRLLASLAALDYPDFEAIIVNDHSTDGSARILSEWDGRHNIRVIEFQDRIEGLTGKKAALQKGIESASNDILAFTDADCAVPTTWLRTINKSMDGRTDYLLGYSIIRRDERDHILRLQNFERGIYYALAAAGLFYRLPITSSACNMVYRKSVFLKAGGFEGIGLLRSGDDDLLLMKMMPRIRQAAYNPSPAMRVDSYSGRDPKAHHQTNVRRASKFRHYPPYLKLLAVSTFLYFSLFYYILALLLWKTPGPLLWSALGLKTAAELCLVLIHSLKVRLPALALLYPVQVLLFPAQFVFYALRGTFGGYRWK